jgi:hypothetical protein
MKNKKSESDHIPEIKMDDFKSEEDIKREEDLKAAAKRRDEYSLIRDLQASENNEAIARRLEKDKEKQG